MTQCYVLFPLHHLSCNVHLNITIIHFNLTRIAFQIARFRIRKNVNFFITLQKIPWQTFKQTVLCSQRKMQWPKQVHVRKLYRERESPAESSCRRLVRWNAFGSRAAEHRSRLSRFAAVTGLEVQRIAEMTANQSGTAGRRLCLGTAAFLYLNHSLVRHKEAQFMFNTLRKDIHVIKERDRP